MVGNSIHLITFAFEFLIFYYEIIQSDRGNQTP